MHQLPSGLYVESSLNGDGHGVPIDSTEALTEQLSKGYKPTLPVEGMFSPDGWPVMSLRRDIEIMLTHPCVRQAMGYFRGGIAGAEFWGGPNADVPEGSPEAEQGLPICQDAKVGRFVKEQCERFWDRGVPGIQHGYEYGWIGVENVYDDADGVLKWERLETFSPRDTWLLTQDFEPIGIRVKNVAGSSKDLDIWMAGEEVPAKAMWYAHCPRFQKFYGQSQLMGAWRPWRRLAWKDGAEYVLDMAMYRFGVGAFIARYPNEDLQGPNPGAGNTTLDGQGNPRRYARDIMRQIGEQFKAGGVIGLPSKRDEKGNYLYDVEVPAGSFVGMETLINGCRELEKGITRGIGVPPELLEAGESGSGYSGRRIPLEAFLANQQQIADAILQLFVKQVLVPLVRYNFGWGVKFNVQVKSLIKTRTKAAQAGQNTSPTRSEGAKKAWETRRAGQQSQVADTQDGGGQGDAMFSRQHPIVTDRMRELAKKIARAA